MIQLFALLIGCFFFYKIFSHKGDIHSLLWVIIGLILVNGMIVITHVPLEMPISRWLIFSLILSHFTSFNRIRLKLKLFPLRIALILLIIGSILIGIFDPRLSLFDKIYAPFREMTETYLILFLSYISLNRNNELKCLNKPLFTLFFIVALYGIFNFVTKSNPYYVFVVDHFFNGSQVNLQSKMRAVNLTDGRFRATSTFSSSFNYGYVSSLVALYFLFLISKAKGNKKKYILGLLFCLVGVFLCFSRTVLGVAFFSFCIYIMLSFSLNLKIKTIIITCFSLVLVYSIVPSVQESINNTVDIFETGGKNTEGSSVEMREVQLFGAFQYFLQSPIRGNGYGYINKELGWGDRDNVETNKDMQGYESIIYQILIQQGLIGLVTKLIFFISLFVFFIRSRRWSVNKRLSNLGISITVLFLLFAIGTGPLGSWPITMIFLGVIIKQIQLNKYLKNEIFYRDIGL